VVGVGRRRGYGSSVPDILRSLGLDVYALTDADSDEARAFTTYLGYWVSLAEHITELYGDPPFEALFAGLRAGGLARLSSKPLSGDADVLRGALLNAWSAKAPCGCLRSAAPLAGRACCRTC